MCYCKDHVAEGCKEWKKPQLAAQYYGSANRGLGFHHIDVVTREGRFKHWAGFENYGVFTIEEGNLSEEEIIKTLKQQVDKEYAWKLMKMDEYRFLVKFPPHIRVESKVLWEANYFYLKSNTVMASLKVWNGDIEPVGQLIETWIQIRGVPPKWSDWTTIKEIASSLGKILEVDWQILFSTFFTVIRVKINCKDPSKIPEKRTMEMDDKLYMINFKMEDLDKLKEKIDGPDEDPDGDTKNGDEGDNGQEEGKVNSSSGDKTLDFEPGTGEEGDNSDKSANQDPTTTQKTAARTQSMRMSLLFLEEKEGQEPNFQSCVDLLSAMELHDSDEESDLLDTDKADEEKMIHLPTEWQFPDFNLITPSVVDRTEKSHPSSEVTTSDQLGPEERGPTTKEIKNFQKASNEKPAEKKKMGTN